MCFSAEASFTGSAVITAIGVTALVRVKKSVQVLFAAIPILFGIQQCGEGFLWVALKSGTHAVMQSTGTYVFLITALVIWPTMIPLSVWMLETEKIRRRILGGLIIAGGICTLFYLYCLVFYEVAPQIQSFHIRYVDNYPDVPVKIAFVLYLIATMVPLFVSSVRRMWVFGGLIAVSCIVTGIFFAQYLTSVWCFFAACISIVIYWILHGSKTGTGQVRIK